MNKILSLLESAEVNELKVWLDTVIGPEQNNKVPINDILLAISSVPRKLKRLQLDPSLCDPARIYLIFCLKNQLAHDSVFLASFQTLFRYCDDDEKTSLIKGVDFFDPDGVIKAFVIDICRTNSTVLLSAIALNNPYPAKHFPELNFNQLVLKALFCELDIRYIKGFEQRRNTELSRMTLDYQNERLAAGRSVPASLRYALDNKD